MAVPLVSVIMPFRNAGAYISDAICSILDQSLSDFEFLIIDDGSQDDSREIVDSHARADSRIRLCDYDGSGVAAALNHGLRIAKGQFIARMDADDVSLPTRFERQVQVLMADPAIGVLGTNVRIIDERRHFLGFTQVPTSPGEIRSILQTKNCVYHSSVMFRTALVRSLGGYRTAFEACEDYDLWLRVSEVADIVNLEEVYLLYRLHEDQVQWTRTEQRIMSELAAVALARCRAGGTPDGIFTGSPIDRPALAGLKIPPEHVDRQMALRTIGAAIDASKFKRYSSALSAVKLALRQPALPIRLRLLCYIMVPWLVFRRSGLLTARKTGHWRE